ncbi:hypothetical protein AVEN_180696-1 [Araneus ventricosus]|uniref:DUF4817 domain-containing protein n=1 Tax=Araneus ventricosus TaxID=182803 RepID=A0A4Y2AW85_ARAVE|nr:hypothetical protein AVEN_180696-1 [Araneus ventricosus]
MFEERGCMCKGKTSGRPRISEENVERIRRTYERSPRKSTYEGSRQLQMPQKTVWRVLRKRLKMKPYVIQLVQQLEQEDYSKRMNYATFMQESMEDETMADRLIFSNESTFHIIGKVNRTVEYGVRRSLPLKRSVTSNVYLDMLEVWLMPQVDSDSMDYIFQEDGAHPHGRRFAHFYANIFQSVGSVEVEMPKMSSALGHRDLRT